MDRPVIYTAFMEREGEDKEKKLVSFGCETPEWGKYIDGSVPESHFTINQHLIGLLGSPEAIFVAFSDQDFLTKTLPHDVDMEDIAKKISESQTDTDHYYAVFPDLGIEVYVGKRGWLSDLKKKAGEA